MVRLVLWLGLVVAPACDSQPRAEPKPTRGAEGLPEVQRAKKGVKDAHEASVQRTDDAVERAMQGEATPRGATPR